MHLKLLFTISRYGNSRSTAGLSKAVGEWIAILTTSTSPSSKAAFRTSWTSRRACWAAVPARPAGGPRQRQEKITAADLADLRKRIAQRRPALVKIRRQDALRLDRHAFPREDRDARPKEAELVGRAVLQGRVDAGPVRKRQG